MATLQVGVHFWTLRDDVQISDSDLSTFKYHPNTKESELLVGPYGPLKKSLCAARDQLWTPGNKRPSRLRDNLTELEEILAHQVLVHIEWAVGASYGTGLLVFNSGLIVHLLTNLITGDLHEILIDKSLEGKLLSDIVSAAVSSEGIFLAHGIPYLTLIQTAQPLFACTNLSPLAHCSLSVNGIQLPGPGTRRQERKIVLSTDGSKVCVWWEREGSELFAWAPVVKAEDRANVLLYSTNSELLACHYTEFNPIAIEFSNRETNCLRITELMSLTKGHLNVVATLYNHQKGFQQMQQRSLRMTAPPRCHCYSPDEQILLLGCVDAQIIAWNLNRDSFVSLKATFIPFHLSWHSSNAFFVASNDRGQLQCWDRALNALPLRLRASTVQREGPVALHLQQYLRHQPTLVTLKWALAPPHPTDGIADRGPLVASQGFRQSRAKSMRSARKKWRSRRATSLTSSETRAAAEYLFVCFERGPLLCLRFLTGCWPATCSLNALTVCSEYLNWRQFEFAVQLLLSLNWTNIGSFQEEDVLLACFTKTVNVLLHQPSDLAAEKLLEKTILTLIDCVKDDEALADPVSDAARKTFRLLSMRNRVPSAAAYALKLQDMDLLVELILLARNMGDQALLQQATTLLACVRESFSSGSSSTSSDSTHSSYTSTDSNTHSSCSTCDDSSSQPPTTDGLGSQLSDLNIRAEESGDQVHVISFGVV